MASARTNTNLNATWTIDDAVVRLREWGTDNKHLLPRPPVDDYMIGSSDTCALVLADPRVSRRHARLRREGTRWWIQDLDSKNGLQEDGAPHLRFVLDPGVEIGIGSTTLIAESERWIALRGFCSRILGWTAEQTSVVDSALRAIRLSARHRMPLVLHGRFDMVPIAQSLHRYTHGLERPFVLCDRRRRQNPDESVRTAATYDTGLAALDAAAGGSLCVRTSGMPQDFDALLLRVREPSSGVQLIVCTDQATRGVDPLTQIDVPPLTTRGGELDWIVQEYAHDATTSLEAPSSTFAVADRAWVLAHARTFPEIEKATLRLVALRTARSIRGAAVRLGMSPVALSRWIERRKPPVEVSA